MAEITMRLRDWIKETQKRIGETLGFGSLPSCRLPPEEAEKLRDDAIRKMDSALMMARRTAMTAVVVAAAVAATSVEHFVPMSIENRLPVSVLNSLSFGTVAWLALVWLTFVEIKAACSHVKLLRMLSTPDRLIAGYVNNSLSVVSLAIVFACMMSFCLVLFAVYSHGNDEFNSLKWLAAPVCLAILWMVYLVALTMAGSRELNESLGLKPVSLKGAIGVMGGTSVAAWWVFVAM